jgi:hypothetical protein
MPFLFYTITRLYICILHSIFLGMRTTLSSLVIIVLAAVSFFGCDKIEDITHTDIGLEITTSSLSVEQPGNTFSSIDSVDLSANQTFKDNKTRIKNLQIDQVLMTLNVRQINGADILQTASANVSKLDGTEETNLGTLSNLSFAALDGVETALILTDAGKQKLSTLLLNSPNQARFTFIGVTDQGPVKFDVSFKIKMTLTAGL